MAFFDLFLSLSRTNSKHILLNIINSREKQFYLLTCIKALSNLLLISCNPRCFLANYGKFFKCIKCNGVMFVLDMFNKSGYFKVLNLTFLICSLILNLTGLEVKPMYALL